KLQLALAGLVINLSEDCTCRIGRCNVIQVRMIEPVESFRAKLDFLSLANTKLLEQRKIVVLVVCVVKQVAYLLLVECPRRRFGEIGRGRVGEGSKRTMQQGAVCVPGFVQWYPGCRCAAGLAKLGYSWYGTVDNPELRSASGPHTCEIVSGGN